MEVMQRQLAASQLAAFYSDRLTTDQVEHFRYLTKDRVIPGAVLDVGGGCGHFARHIANATGHAVRVMDTDPTSIEACKAAHIEAVQGNALAPQPTGDESVICFNLMLHHLIGGSERETRQMQKLALSAWKDKADYLFVHEYVYDSIFDISGRLIYSITKSKLLSGIARLIGKFVPSLRANTLGVGVRFRSESSWYMVFDEAGYEVLDTAQGPIESLPLPRRLLLIKSKRRCSYLLIQKDRVRGQWP